MRRNSRDKEEELQPGSGAKHAKGNDSASIIHTPPLATHLPAAPGYTQYRVIRGGQ